MGFNYKRDIGRQIVEDPQGAAESVAERLGRHEAYLDFHGTGGTVPPTREEQVGVPQGTDESGSYFTDVYLSE